MTVGTLEGQKVVMKEYGKTFIKQTVNTELEFYKILQENTDIKSQIESIFPKVVSIDKN